VITREPAAYLLVTDLQGYILVTDLQGYFQNLKLPVMVVGALRLQLKGFRPFQS
jgi:hypothetical protein